jgi:transcriptional regulator with GAF, ATPase, and Fis domain
MEFVDQERWEFFLAQELEISMLRTENRALRNELVRKSSGAEDKQKHFGTAGYSLDDELAATEWQRIDEAVSVSGGNIKAAAAGLGLKRTTLTSRIDRHKAMAAHA